MRFKTLGLYAIGIAVLVVPAAFARADLEWEHAGQFYWSRPGDYSTAVSSETSGVKPNERENTRENSSRSRSVNPANMESNGGAFIEKLIQSIQKQNAPEKPPAAEPTPIAPNTSAPRVLIEQVVQNAIQSVQPSIVIPTSTPPRQAEPVTPTASTTSTQQQGSTPQTPSTSSAPTNNEPAPQRPPQLVDFIGQAIGTYIKQVSDSTSTSRRPGREDNRVESATSTATETAPVQSTTSPATAITIPVVIKTQATTSDGEKKISAGAETRKDQQVAKSLDEIGQAIHAIVTSKKSVEKKVENIVSEKVEETVKSVEQTLPPASTSTAPVAFSEQDRQQVIEKIRQRAEEKGKAITAEITGTITSPPSGHYIPGQVDPVLKSSLVEIQEIVLSETGVAVDVTPGARAVVEDVKAIEETARQIDEQRKVLSAREGLELYRDSDKDGVSDYDEKNIYHTDPNNAYTAGSALTDGERILLGFDVHSPAPALVPVESPKVAGAETKSMFEVTEIALVPAAPAPVAAEAAPVAIAPAPAAESTGAVPTRPSLEDKKVQIKGKALPNSFVTLYIYSNPIVVTVKADESGLWTYTLDSTLEDGNHEVYVASVNNSGKIIAKSAPIPFVKTADALEFEPLTIQEVTQVSPLDTLREHFLVTGGVFLALFALIALAAVGMRRDGAAAA